MGSFIIFILFVIAIIVIFILSIGFSILRIFLGKPKFGKSGSKTSNSSNENDKPSGKNDNKKVFGKNEGEYIDYEEID